MVETDNSELPPDGTVEPGTYGFVTTVLANYDDLAALREDVSALWAESDAGPPVLEFLTSDLSLMSGETQEAARRLPPGHWNMSTFVGFLQRSASGKAEARSLVLESCMRVQ